MKKAAIVACSNARQSKYRQETEDLTAFLESIGIQAEMWQTRFWMILIMRE
jgi:hypothetical protein